MGCYLSHREVWRRIAQGPAGGGFVFEDDIVPCGPFAEAMATIEAEPNDWDVVKLLSDRPWRGRLVYSGEVELRRPLVLPRFTMAYALKRAGAAKLLHASETFFRPVDQDLKHWWEKDVRVLVTSPSVVRPVETYRTTSDLVADRWRVRSHPLARFLLNVRYQARFRTHLYWHGLRLLTVGEARTRGGS